MQPTRRGFLKVGTGAIVASVLGFDVKTGLRPSPGTQDRPDHGDALDVPVLLGELRRHHPHHRRQGQERDAAGGARRRRSGSSHQSRHAVSQGLVADAGHPERAPRAEAASAPAGLRSLGRHRVGSGLRRDGAPHQEDARRHVHHDRRAGPHRQSRWRASPGTAAAPTPTNSITWLSKPCAAWG